MKRYPKPLTIAGINMRENKINPKPAYQRGPVWTQKQKQLLMDTILRDLDIPKFGELPDDLKDAFINLLISELMEKYVLTSREEDLFNCLKQLDEQRNVINEQRVAIYRKNKGICPECGEKCEWENWHADHIIPWSQGGHTTVENGQVLCPTCNLRKGGER